MRRTEYIYKEELEQAKERASTHLCEKKSIGTLSEKSVHGVLKYFLEPDESLHEISLEGYHADIYNDKTGIVEIQSKQFYRLCPKLEVFLKKYTVTVVYPVIYDKWIHQLDKESGEIVSARKSPKHFTVYDGLAELYRLRRYLQNPSLKVTFIMMDIDEYKHGREKIDRIPIGIRDIINLTCKKDYKSLLPDDMPANFTAKEFAAAAKIPASTAGAALNVLYQMEAVKRVGKKGNAYIYEVTGA